MKYRVRRKELSLETRVSLLILGKILRQMNVGSRVRFTWVSMRETQELEPGTRIAVTNLRPLVLKLNPSVKTT